jgi:putative endonuclease
MVNRKIQLGRQGENIIDRALREYHYTIITRNWRCEFGEVDLVAKRNGEWYFVEVRTRRGSKSISPEQGFTTRKRETMEKVARKYIGHHASDEDSVWHLSFAAVIVNPSGSIDRITFYPDLYGEGVDLL